MDIVERIIEELKSIPESSQAEVLDFVEYLKSKKGRKEEDSEWSRFSLDSAMRGIEEEPSPYVRGGRPQNQLNQPNRRGT